MSEVCDPHVDQIVPLLAIPLEVHAFVQNCQLLLIVNEDPIVLVGP